MPARQYAVPGVLSLYVSESRAGQEAVPTPGYLNEAQASAVPNGPMVTIIPP